MSHLLRRCSHTSQAERNFIYRAIQQQNPVPPARGSTITHSPVRTIDGSGLRRSPQTLQQLSSQTQHQSALDTLAEVSRQQLDVPSHDQPGQNDVIEAKQTPQTSGKQDAEDRFYAQLREAVKSGTGTHASRDEAQPERQISNHGPPIHASTPLVETAAAANEQLHQASSPGNLDPALERQHVVMDEGSPISTSDHPHPAQQADGPNEPEVAAPRGLPYLNDGTNEPATIVSREFPLSGNHGPMSWIPTSGPIEVQPASHNLRNILAAAKKPLKFLPTADLTGANALSTNLADGNATTDQSTSGFGPLRNGTKVRSKFSDNRRKEVQEVRKRGACIRCRMLKKPCSEGTPCNTCKTVGSARLWKGSCLRTRLADEFTLWSVGLFTNKAQNAVDEAGHGIERSSMEAVVELSLLSRSESYVVLAARKYNQTALAKQRAAVDAYDGEGPDLRLRAHFEADRDSLPFYLLEEEAAVSAELDRHSLQLINSVIEEETSPFLKMTLQRALTMIREEESEPAVQPATSSTSVRTSYILQNQLLRNVVDLWASTSLLTHSTPADVVVWTSNQYHSPSLQPQNKAVLHTQLLSLLESRCSTLSKSIISELERRLLQRQQVSRFGTFLSSIILLNCIERMTEYVHSVESGKSEEQQDSMNGMWRQGEQFTALLGMMLRMRGLVPRTTSDERGKTIVAKRPDLGGNASESKKQENEAMQMAAQWLDPLAISFEALREMKDKEVPRRSEVQERVGWDMKFIAGVLISDDGRK